MIPISCPKTFHSFHGIDIKVSLCFLQESWFHFLFQLLELSGHLSTSTEKGLHLLPQASHLQASADAILHARNAFSSQVRCSSWQPLPPAGFRTTLGQTWFLRPLSPPSSISYLFIVLTSYLMLLLYTPLVQEYTCLICLGITGVPKISDGQIWKRKQFPDQKTWTRRIHTHWLAWHLLP